MYTFIISTNRVLFSYFPNLQAQHCNYAMLLAGRCYRAYSMLVRFGLQYSPIPCYDVPDRNIYVTLLWNLVVLWFSFRQPLY